MFAGLGEETVLIEDSVEGPIDTDVAKEQAGHILWDAL
jgi:hypothetical protein